MSEYSKEIHSRVLDLIKSARRFGVNKLEVGPLGLKFELGEENFNEKPTRLTKSQVELGLKAAKVENFREREFKFSQMDIEDPLAYEQMITSNSEKEFLDAEQDDIRSQ